MKTDYKYKKQLNIFPNGENPFQNRKGLKMVMFDKVLFNYDSTWRIIDELAVLNGFDNYYDLWQQAREQGDEKKLPYKFKTVYVD